MKITKKLLVKIVFSLIILIVISAFCLYFIFQVGNVNGMQMVDGSSGTERKYNILIITGGRGETFSRQILRGAQSAAQKYNCAIEFYVPENTNENDLQNLFDYASFLEPDGIIAYIPDYQKKLSVPVYHDGQAIPLVTVGTYIPELPQVSYIGINYSELGEIIAREIINFSKENEKVWLFYSDYINNQNYSLLMNSLAAKTSEYPDIKINSMSIFQNDVGIKNDLIKQKIQGLPEKHGKKNLLITLSEETSVLVAQTIVDLNYGEKASVIAFSDNTDSRAYYEKGIISELISVNALYIGRKAVEEIFEYKKTGYANNYIIAGIDILKKGGSNDF